MSQIPTAWFSVALKGYRDHPEPYRAYSPFSYEALPPLPTALFDCKFSWLSGQARYQNEPAYWQSTYVPILKQLSIDGVGFPESFRNFMGTFDLPSRIRSATDCTFDLASKTVVVPWMDRYLYRFMSDSQGCLYWYLCLAKDGSHCIVTTDQFFGGHPTSDDKFMEKHLGPDWDADDPPDTNRSFWLCAPDFESFIYRFWIENEIWFLFDGDNGNQLTAEQRRYLAHYG